MSVSFKNIQKIYSNNSKPIIRNLNLEIENGEFLALTGPSGSGKSTVLRMLAGLESATSGEIFIDKKKVTKLSPRERNISMVFQQFSLYPYMSVAKNMAFPLKILGINNSEIKSNVEKVAQELELTELLDRNSQFLSSGQKRRVAIGRALVRIIAKKPKVFLLDEPLANLDVKLKSKICLQIAALQRKLKITTIYVTHDKAEILQTADRTVVLNKGVLQ
ncbi:MAG: ATP-binding cassette domain-containing protein [Bifidobacteriaceae bacterium]|jgi:ABC-type sugar transport system ATPase subunit|nr:ATP-binding cassette domain-containing protein [Bifidobacteriaceae bacterium]